MHLTSTSPCGLATYVLVCHFEAKGSVPNATMIFFFCWSISAPVAYCFIAFSHMHSFAANYFQATCSHTHRKIMSDLSSVCITTCVLDHFLRIPSQAVRNGPASGCTQWWIREVTLVLSVCMYVCFFFVCSSPTSTISRNGSVEGLRRDPLRGGLAHDGDRQQQKWRGNCLLLWQPVATDILHKCEFSAMQRSHFLPSLLTSGYIKTSCSASNKLQQKYIVKLTG